MYQWHVMFKDLVDKKNHRPNVCFWLKGLQMRSIMPPNKSGNCRWGLWTTVFCQIYLQMSIFCSSFQKCLLQHLMGKSEFKKGRATSLAKTQRQPTCFHMFPCVIGTRRLKKNPFEFEVVRWVEGKGFRTHNLHRFTVICGILWRCWGICLVLAAWGLGLFRPTMVVGHLNVTDAQGIAMQKWSYGMHTWYPLVSYDHGIWWVFRILSPTSRSRHFCSCEGGWDAEHWWPRAELSQLRPCCIASVFCIAFVLVWMLKVQFREKDDRMGLTPRAKWPGCLQWKCLWR